MHRFRLVLASDWVRLTEGTNGDNTERFHYAPLIIEAGYQLQFAKYLMLRAAVGVGGNVANSRYAIPVVVRPGARFGVQGRIVGFSAGYYYSAHIPSIANATDGRDGSVGAPALQHGHQVGGELTFESRVDRSVLTFAVGFGAVNTRIQHLSVANGRQWFPVLNLGFGVLFDGTIARERKAKKRREQYKSLSEPAG